MAQNAAQLLMKTPQFPEANQGAPAPAPPRFPDVFIRKFGAALGAQLSVRVTLGLHRHTRPRAATLRGHLAKHQLIAEFAQPRAASAYLFIPDLLARQIVAQRLCAQSSDKPLSAIDLALCSVLGEQVQVVLQHWQPAMPVTVGALKYGPVKPGGMADWHSYEFEIALAGRRPSRLRLVLPAPLAAPPRLAPPPAAPAKTLSPAALNAALARACLPLRAVLHRQHMAPDLVASLQVGDVLELPSDSLNALALEMGDAQATPIAQARLGAFDGQKVLKLLAPPDAAGLTLPAK